MSTHNICFYGEISKIIPFNYHQVPSLSVLLKTVHCSFLSLNISSLSLYHMLATTISHESDLKYQLTELYEVAFPCQMPSLVFCKHAETLPCQSPRICSSSAGHFYLL